MERVGVAKPFSARYSLYDKVYSMIYDSGSISEWASSLLLRLYQPTLSLSPDGAGEVACAASSRELLQDGLQLLLTVSPKPLTP